MNRLSRTQRGFTLLEVLAVLFLAGLILGTGAAAWHTYQRSSAASATAVMVRQGLEQARMLSIYRGVHHFVVLDPGARTVRVFEDSSAPQKSFDTGDREISSVRWSPSVALDVPTAPSPLPRPMGGGNVAAAWDLPLPDSSAAWGPKLIGVMTTPEGKIMSGAATPQVIVFGTIVFHDPDRGQQTVGLGLEGLSGIVRSFRLDGSAWEAI